MHNKTRITFIGLIAVAALAAGGCQKKLTYERWETLRAGQNIKAVKSTLGKPLDERKDRIIYTDQDRGIAVHVLFEPKDKSLIYTEWTDPVHGTRAIGTMPER